jgi:cell fate regulator YaaT (PSP1 superfamily)
MCQGKGNYIKTINFFLVKIPYTQDVEIAYFYSDDAIKSQQEVVVKMRYGVDIVRVLASTVATKTVDMAEILRKATSVDLLQHKANRDRAELLYKASKKTILVHGLAIKLISAHVLMEDNKLLLFFTADQRVDFRNLVKDLISEFHMRIELRQIGVRDETRSLGGLAICGRSYCCYSLGEQPKAVSIKMAKDQGLSANSTKISGGCGRLLCCLGYEHDYYVAEKVTVPAVRDRVIYENQEWYVYDVNILNHKIILQSLEGSSRLVDARQFNKNTKTGQWICVGDKTIVASNDGQLGQTSCGCTRVKGTRCKGCCDQHE